MRLAFCLSGSNDRAEDLVQETVARSVRRIGTVRDPGNYLRTTLVNVWRSEQRRRAIRMRALPGSPSPASDMPRDLVEFRDVLLALPTRQRAAVVLRYVADLDDADIAGILKCRQATVRSLVKRGLDRLRNDLS